jgi:hypothetical protein
MKPQLAGFGIQLKLERAFALSIAPGSKIKNSLLRGVLFPGEKPTPIPA